MPFAPIKPILSPRWMIAEKSFIISLLSYWNEACSSSATILPLFSPALSWNDTCPCRSRRAARWRRSSSKRRTRPSLRVRRASMPLRIHASSCAWNLSNRRLCSASTASSCAFFSLYLAKLPSYERSVPRSSSTMRVAMLSKKRRSWVMTMRMPEKPRSRFSSQIIASMSRWLVGSSSSNTSGFCTHAWARATRFFCPPDRLPMRSFSGSPSSLIVWRMAASNCQPFCASIWFCRVLSSLIKSLFWLCSSSWLIWW